MHDLPALPLPIRCLAGALLLVPATGCVLGEGILGQYTDTDTDTDTGTGTGANTGGDSGTSGDEPSCPENCEPSFAVGYLLGANYARDSIRRLSPSTCDGPSCPEIVDPVAPDGTPIEECLQTEAAQTSPLGAEEHCRLTPGWLAVRIDVGFTTPVDRSSFEVVRPLLADPTTEEPYLWHPDVVTLQGPGTAVRGRYVLDPASARGRLTSIVNETCAERLTALGIPWTPDELESLCVGTWDDGGVLRPLRMAPAMVFSSYAGILSSDLGSSCDTPDAGPDTCCSACDWMLGPQVARYGVDAAGARRNANEDTAIPCDAAGDVLVECRDLVLDVERDPGLSYTYAWDGAAADWPLPRYDKLRETHPEDRPAGLEAGATCSTADECAVGQACIGTNAAGDACLTGADCGARTCRAEWFGRCEITEGGSAFCVDRRFSSRGAGACMAATADFANGVEGDRLSLCDTDGDGQASASECCDAALGGEAGCDPFYQPNLVGVPRYDRDPFLPPEAACVCEEGAAAACADVVDAWCDAPLGSASAPQPVSSAGDYALPMVTRLGGVRWNESVSRLSVHLATEGNVPRANTEACAESHQLIGVRNPEDGWLAHSSYGYQDTELLEDHDLALCSGSTYRLVLTESDGEHYIRSMENESLDGRSTHVIETPQFRVAPDSVQALEGAPVKSCQTLTVQLSNAYDASQANVRKLEIRAGAPDGLRVAGGADCDPLASAAEIAAGAIPCVGIDAEGGRDWLSFYIDESIHGQVLQPGPTYFVVLPGLPSIAQMADAEAYVAAFHDVCGMPLIVGETAEQVALSELSFTIDEACE